MNYLYIYSKRDNTCRNVKNKVEYVFEILERALTQIKSHIEREINIFLLYFQLNKSMYFLISI